MKYSLLVSVIAPFLVSCTTTPPVRFSDCAFHTEPGQRVKIVTRRGKTEVQGVINSRDIVVRGSLRADASANSTARLDAVKVIDTSIPQERGKFLRLEVVGIPPNSSVRLDTEFLVPKDVRLEIEDGPDDLAVKDLDAGLVIRDAAGNITLSSLQGPVDIASSDGDVLFTEGKGPVKVVDRRGDIILEEITGDIEIDDREGDIGIQSVTGDVTLSKKDPAGRGKVRIENLDGNWKIREWDNPSKPIINTIWSKAGVERTPPKPAPREGRAGAAADEDER
jgi:hypothetical protein